MVLFAEINQAPSPCSTLQHIDRAATPKLVPRNCLRYMQTTLIMEGVGLISEFMWGIVASYVSLNFINLIRRRRDFPVKVETFYDFQHFLMYTTPFNVIFSFSKTKIPGIYMFKVDKNCWLETYFTQTLMFLLLTLNV